MPPESALPDLFAYGLETSSHYKDGNQSYEMAKPVCGAGESGEVALGVWEGLCSEVVAAFRGLFVVGRTGVSAPGIHRLCPAKDQLCSCS